MAHTHSLDCSDPKILTELYQKLTPLAVSKTEYITGETSVAQDIVQETFVKMWQQRLVFPSLAAAYSWAYKACHNAAIDYLRSHKYRLTHQRQAILEEPRLVRSAEDRLLNRSLLLAVIAQLNEREGQILAYQIIDGLSHREIARLLDISEKTVQRDCLALQRKLVALRSATYE